MPFRFFPLINHSKFSDDNLGLRMSKLYPLPKRGDSTYRVEKKSDLYTVDFKYMASGNGALILEENYLIKNWADDDPYLLFGFNYSIRITDRYRLFIHYHPDSLDKLHSLVHMEFRNEDERKLRKVYFNPMKQINIPEIKKNGGEELHLMWDFDNDWPNFFFEMYGKHVSDKKVTVEDCYSSIMKKL